MSRAGAARQPSRAPVAPSGNQPRVWGRQGGDPYSKALDFAPRQNCLQLGSDKAHSSLARASSAWCGNLQAPTAKATLWLCFHLALAPSGGVRRASSFGTMHRPPKRPGLQSCGGEGGTGLLCSGCFHPGCPQRALGEVSRKTKVSKWLIPK